MVERVLNLFDPEFFPETQGVSVGLNQQKQVTVQVHEGQRLVLREELGDQEVLGRERELKGRVVDQWRNQRVPGVGR